MSIDIIKYDGESDLPYCIYNLYQSVFSTSVFVSTYVLYIINIDVWLESHVNKS